MIITKMLMKGEKSGFLLPFLDNHVAEDKIFYLEADTILAIFAS